jgi:hypothetical protein
MSLAINKPSKGNQIMLTHVHNVELAITQLAECGVTVLNADLMSYAKPVIWVNGNEFRKAFEVSENAVYYWRNNQLYSTVNNLLFNCRIVWGDAQPTTLIH